MPVTLKIADGGQTRRVALEALARVRDRAADGDTELPCTWTVS